MKGEVSFLMLYPPLAEPYVPCLSIPELSAVLKKNGYPCQSLDLNLAVHDELLTGALFRESVEAIVSTGAKPALNNRLRQESFFDKKAAVLYLRSLGGFLADRLDDAKQQLRQKETYLFDAYGRARSDKPFFIFDRARRIFFLSPLLHPYTSHENQSYYLFPGNLKTAIKSYKSSLYHPLFQRYLTTKCPQTPKVVGISITFAEQVIPAFLLAAEAKNIWPEAIVLMGGNYPTLLMERLINIPELFAVVDGFVQGAGEQTLLRIGGNLSRGISWSEGSDNIAYKQGDLTIEPTVFGQWDVRESPPPDFDDFAGLPYFVAQPQLAYMTGRGCYWGKCKFCNYPATQPKYRPRGVDQIVGDLSYLTSRYGINAFHFADDAVAPRRLVSISNAINNNGLNLHWWCLSRFDRTNGKLWSQEEIKEIMAAGCYRIFFGGESMDHDVQKGCNKGLSVSDIENGLEEIKATPLHAHVSFIIGMPGESLSTARKTVDWALDIASNQRLSTRVHRFRLARGSVYSEDQSVLTRNENESTCLAPNIKYYHETGRNPDSQNDFSNKITELKSLFLRKYFDLPVHSYPENHNYEGLQYQLNYGGQIPNSNTSNDINKDLRITLRLNPVVGFGVISEQEAHAWGNRTNQGTGAEADSAKYNYLLLFNFRDESYLILPDYLAFWFKELETGGSYEEALGNMLDESDRNDLVEYLINNNWLERYPA